MIKPPDSWVEPTESGADLIGRDGNAFAIMGFVQGALKRAGNSREVTEAYFDEATDGDYDHLLRASLAYLGDL